MCKQIVNHKGLIELSSDISLWPQMNVVGIRPKVEGISKKRVLPIAAAEMVLHSGYALVQGLY
jgi:hypothetical protein